MCRTPDDHLSPSGTIERAREAVESASRSILANRAAAVASQEENKEDDSVFVKPGSFKAFKKGTENNNNLALLLSFVSLEMWVP